MTARFDSLRRGVVARFFRFVEKKRGRRRTGSNLVGSLGEAIFCGVLFLLGTFSLSALIVNQVLQPDPGSFAIGVGRWLAILAMGSLVIIGGGGLIWTVLRIGTSAERRSALARRATDLDLVHEAVPHPRNYPTVPPFDGLTNSPGIELAYRLPPSESPGWRLFATTLFALVWNFVGCLLTVSAIGSLIAGRPEWLLTLLLVPFWGVSFWSIRYWLQLLMLHTGMGMTTLEISDLPLVPGREYQVALSQHGQIAVKSLQVWLVCEEEATYHQGTDIRTETREVYRRRIYERGGFRIEPGGAFHDVAAFDVPAAAMHSFTSQHHAIRWKLVVRGEAEGWPEFQRGFPLVVFPGEATMQAETGGDVARAALRTHTPPPRAVEARA
jgi:hypothetical protein